MKSGTSLVERARRRAPQPAAVAEGGTDRGKPRGEFARVLGLGLLGAVLLWLALPPADLSWLIERAANWLARVSGVSGLGAVPLAALVGDLSWLAWLAPVPWLVLVHRPQLVGRAPYVAIWMAGSVHWLAVLQGIRLPHPALYVGWTALSLYLAVYLPLFVGIARVAVHRWHWPLWLAAPVVWTGLELARGHMITGFSGALLGHTLVEWLPLIQIADLFGAYGVSFLVMLVAAAITATLVGWREGRVPRFALLAAGIALTLTIVYGTYRMRPRESAAADGPTVAVAMLQGTYDTIFEYDPQRNVDVFEQYLRVARKASEERPELELLIWPESMFTENNPNWIVDGALPQPKQFRDVPADEYQRKAQLRAQAFLEKAQYVADAVNQGRQVPLHQIVGVETVDLRQDPALRYNSALLLTPAGRPAGRYDKMHLVMFGEYIPFARWLPWLYEISPMGGGTAVGEGPKVFPIGGLQFAPTVCFESFVPHLVRRQLVTLERQGTPADVLVNLTHDGWFWGSSILDLHRTCAVFRAVEHRKPMLTAANPGLTAWIDGNGRIVRALERHREDYLVARVGKDARGSIYRQVGDWPAGICLALTIAMAWSGVFRRKMM